MTMSLLNAPLAPVTLALAAWTAGDPQQSPVVARIHDISATRPVGDGSFEHRTPMLPLLVDEGSNSNGSEDRRPTVRDANVVVDLLRTLNSAMWESEGRELAMIEDTRLLVKAPASDQEVIARELAFLEDSLGRPTRIVFDLVTFGPNPGVENLPSLVPTTDIDRWVGVALNHQRHELSILPGECADVTSERVVTMLMNIDVQIAAHTFGFEPQPAQVPVGTHIETAVAPARGGLWLALNVRESRLLGAVESREQALTAMVTTDNELARIEGPRTRDDARLANHSMSINAFLPDGKALVMQSSVGLETHVVFVHQEGGTTPSMYKLPDDLKRAVTAVETTLMRADAANPPVAKVVRPEGSGPLKASRFARIDLGGGAETFSYIQPANTNVLVDAFQYSPTGGTTTLSDTWIVAPCSTRAELDPHLAVYAQLTPEPRALQARLTLRKGLRDTTVLARALLPIRIGAGSTVVLGRESFATVRAANEVAEGASGPAPMVAILFDGFVVTLTPESMSNGGLSLGLETHARWSRDVPRTFDAGTVNIPKLQLQDSDVLDAVRSVVFTKSETGVKHVTLGNAGSANDALTLDVEITDLR